MCAGSLATKDALHVIAVRVSFARISRKIRMICTCISISLCVKDAIFLALFLSVAIAKIGFVKVV